MLRDDSPIGNRLLAGFFFLFFLSSLSATPFDCLIQSNSVQVLNACFEQYFAHTDTLSLEEWQAALPTGSESFQMRQLVDVLYRSRNFTQDCSLQTLEFYGFLRSQINITLFRGRYCVIYERNLISSGRRFARFWGYATLVDRSGGPSRALHHSAAHVFSDGNVCNESAAVFEQSDSRTLVVAGASRFAVIGNATNTCQTTDAIADAAHNNRTMFHVFNMAIHDAVISADGCEFENCAFIQWHGMANTSCPSSAAFVSAGVSGSSPVYQIQTTPAVKIAAAYNAITGTAQAHTPRTDTQCDLVASTNVFGRFIYGVPADRVCSDIARPQDVTATFVHIEQKPSVREDWGSWSDALKQSFPMT